MSKRSRKMGIDEDILREVSDRPEQATVGSESALSEEMQPAGASLVTLAGHVSGDYSRFTDFDIELFKAGKHFHLYNKLGAHTVEDGGHVGTYFSVWAPNARYMSVIGNFNGWDRGSHPMSVRWDGSGIWEVFIPGLKQGEFYKYYLESFPGIRMLI